MAAKEAALAEAMKIKETGLSGGLESFPEGIHPTAIVSPEAKLGKGVRIGPWCSVGPDVEVGDGVEMVANVVVDGHTRLGENSRYYPFTTVGLAPQDLKYNGEPTRCEIGARTVVREHVTIHRGTATGSGITRVGSDCLIMANAHVAHDCTLGDRVIIVNNVVMGGHVFIADDARVMGSAAIHQFVRIGRAALVGGVAGVEADVIPMAVCWETGRVWWDCTGSGCVDMGSSWKSVIGCVRLSGFYTHVTVRVTFLRHASNRSGRSFRMIRVSLKFSRLSTRRPAVGLCALRRPIFPQVKPKPVKAAGCEFV